MAIILCVETSSKNCSVSISKDGQIYNSLEELDENYCHGQKLHILIKELLLDSKLSIKELDAFCFSSGPGSYTGLRIGSAAVKGLSFVLKKPIITISTLQSLSWDFLYNSDNTFLEDKNKPKLYCPVMDSRQGEVYAAIYDSTLTEYLSPFPCDIIQFSFLDFLEKNIICFFGPGKYKLEKIIKHKNAVFFDNYIPSSKSLCFLAEEGFQNNNFVDPAYFEPLYLKNFVPNIGQK